jgi:aspartate 1-decarboxylase
MLRNVMKSKIHRVTVTEANLQYEGSITVDEDLLKAADIVPGEKLQVINLANGSRIETYGLPGPAGSGTICLNGGAARWGLPGDTLILIAYAWIDSREAASFQPKVVLVDAQNRIRETVSTHGG